MVASLKIIRKFISKIIKRLRIARCLKYVRLRNFDNFLIQVLYNFEAKGRPIFTYES